MTETEAGFGPADAYGPTEDYSERTVPYYKAETVRILMRGRWQTIETAPRDGKPVLVFEPGHTGGVFKAHLARMMSGREEWITHGALHGLRPTHWMPMPEGPK